MMRMPSWFCLDLPDPSLLLRSDPVLDMACAPVNLSLHGAAAAEGSHGKVAMLPVVREPDLA